MTMIQAFIEFHSFFCQKEFVKPSLCGLITFIPEEEESKSLILIKIKVSKAEILLAMGLSREELIYFSSYKTANI